MKPEMIVGILFAAERLFDWVRDLIEKDNTQLSNEERIAANEASLRIVARANELRQKLGLDPVA